MEDKELFAKLRQHDGIEESSKLPVPVVNEPTSGFGKKTSSLPEKYSVATLLNSPEIILKRMDKPSEAVILPEDEHAFSPAVTPEHMQHWLTKLRLNQTIDQAHQQVVQQEQKIDAYVDVHALQRIQEVTRWIDDSVLNKLFDATACLNKLKYTASASWLKALDRACGNEWRTQGNYTDRSKINSICNSFH